MKKKIVFFWSGGKDSAYALYKLQQSKNYEIKCLISVLNKKSNTINFHGVKDSLLIQQANLLGIPLQRIHLKDKASNIEYIEVVSKYLEIFKNAGIEACAFGDINLKDLRAFKDNFIHSMDLETIYPLWEKDTKMIAQEIIASPLRATITSSKADLCGINIIGKEYNEDFINSLPSNIDPCGENGEFHTFVSFAPGFKSRVQFSKNMPVREDQYFISYLKDN